MAPEIPADTLRVTDLVPNDAAALFEYRSDPEVARFQPWRHGSVAETRDFIARNRASPFGLAGSWYQLAVRARGPDALVGDLGVHFLTGEGPQVEIGVSIAPARQRQGFGVAAIRALLDHLFTVRGAHRVIASVDPRNTASLALMRRAGLRQEAHHRQSLFWEGQWVDDVVFALLRMEWTSPSGAPAPDPPATR